MNDVSDTPKTGWFSRLKAGLARSSGKLVSGIGDIFTKKKLDDETLAHLEELLIGADIGSVTAGKLVQDLAKARVGKEISGDEVRGLFAEEIGRVLEPVARPLSVDTSKKPFVLLMVGVNGAGKTTTIGKLAQIYKEQGFKCALAAGDTFRAAAVEQLRVWGARTGSPVIARDAGSDAASLAFEALMESRKRGDDVLLIDTAGRLHNKENLMNELRKIVRVIKKVDESAPHATLLVLDSTIGQNAHAQVETFKQIVGVTGLVLTKLDGTAKGGVVVALAEKFGLPIHFIGVGEGVEDLRPFTSHSFARSLMGLEPV
jgi:fused signal recognition particle receptor